MEANAVREQLDAVVVWLVETCRGQLIGAPVYDKDLELYSFEINRGDVGTLAVDEAWLNARKPTEIAVGLANARVTAGVLRACGEDHMIWVNEDGFIVRGK